MAKWTVSSAIRRLKQAPRSISPRELDRMLSDLGFFMWEGKAANHKLFAHPEIPEFAGGGFNATHSAKGPVPPTYISTIRQTLEEHREALEELGYG